MTVPAGFPEDTLRVAMRGQHERVLADDTLPLADLARPLTPGLIVLALGVAGVQLARSVVLGTVAEPAVAIGWVLVAISVALVIPAALRGTPVGGVTAGYVVGSSLGVLVLDVISGWSSASGVGVLTAGSAVGVALAMLGGAGWPRLAVWVAASLAAVALVLDVVGAGLSPTSFASLVIDVLAICGPAVFWALVAATFKRAAPSRIERARAALVAQQGGFTLGMRASEDLVVLDLESEALLRRVANGEEPIPLPRARAEEAARLASLLRQHLLAARQDSWLAHTIGESPTLSAAVTLHDPSSIAARLEPIARDSLLRALWLLVDESDRQRVQLEFAPAVSSGRQVTSTLRLRLERPVRRRALAHRTLAQVGTVQFDGGQLDEVTASVVIGLSRIGNDAP